MNKNTTNTICLWATETWESSDFKPYGEITLATPILNGSREIDRQFSAPDGEEIEGRTE